MHAYRDMLASMHACIHANACMQAHSCACACMHALYNCVHGYKLQMNEMTTKRSAETIMVQYVRCMYIRLLCLYFVKPLKDVVFLLIAFVCRYLLV